MTQSSALMSADTSWRQLAIYYSVLLFYIYVALVMGVPYKPESHSLTTKEIHPNAKSGQTHCMLSCYRSFNLNIP